MPGAVGNWAVVPRGRSPAQVQATAEHEEEHGDGRRDMGTFRRVPSDLSRAGLRQPARGRRSTEPAEHGRADPPAAAPAATRAPGAGEVRVVTSVGYDDAWSARPRHG